MIIPGLLLAGTLRQVFAPQERDTQIHPHPDPWYHFLLEKVPQQFWCSLKEFPLRPPECKSCRRWCMSQIDEHSENWQIWSLAKIFIVQQLTIYYWSNQCLLIRMFSSSNPLFLQLVCSFWPRPVNRRAQRFLKRFLINWQFTRPWDKSFINEWKVRFVA